MRLAVLLLPALLLFAPGPADAACRSCGCDPCGRMHRSWRTPSERYAAPRHRSDRPLCCVTRPHRPRYR